MKLSRVILNSACIMLFATLVSVSFANAKDHDGEIIAYMEAINKHEIAAANVAKDKKVDADVMKYADLMVEQHSANLQQVTDLSTKINVAADETPAVKKFMEKGDKDLDKLSKLDNTKFQKAYIHAMIEGHKNVDTMLKKFEKEAKNTELKQYLVDTKTVVEHHLAEAKTLK
jgi:putative membrane protein